MSDQNPYVGVLNEAKDEISQRLLNSLFVSLLVAMCVANFEVLVWLLSLDVDPVVRIEGIKRGATLDSVPTYTIAAYFLYLTTIWVNVVIKGRFTYLLNWVSKFFEVREKQRIQRIEKGSVVLALKDELKDMDRAIRRLEKSKYEFAEVFAKAENIRDERLEVIETTASVLGYFLGPANEHFVEVDEFADYVEALQNALDSAEQSSQWATTGRSWLNDVLNGSVKLEKEPMKSLFPDS